MALGLDQTPKSLLPAITRRWVLPITVVNNFLVTGQPNPIQGVDQERDAMNGFGVAK